MILHGTGLVDMAGLKTSRLADQTSKVVNALAGRATRARTSGVISHTRTEASLHTDAVENQVPKTPKRRSTHDQGSVDVVKTPSSLKRKRGESDPRSPVITKIKEESVSTTTSPGQIATGKPKKARRQPAKKVKGANGTTLVEPPPNWEEVYSTTKEMRSLMLAPVDTMGCENLAEDLRSPRDKRYQTLTALMLSSQTKDTVTAVAMKNLQDGLPGGFTLESMLEVEPSMLNSLIDKVGFHNNKTKYIKATAEILRDGFDSDIPDTIEGMISLPGVGPKMAYLCMSAAWHRHEGIGVDVHVHRITNLWGWHKTQTPEETRASLESWLPKEKWHDINHLLVGFGQTWCPPVGRKCDECFLAAKGLCPSALVGQKSKTKVKKQEVSVKDEEGERPVKNEVDVKTEVSPIKAEDLSRSASTTTSAALPDLEDLWGRRRSARLAT